LLLTGALHFDGFCDLADAALVPKSPADRWRILKDPHLGSFALAAGTLLLLVKVAALAELIALGTQGWPLIAAIPVLSRSVVTGIMAGFPVYDASLLGRHANLPWRETLLPVASGVAVSALLVVGGGAFGAAGEDAAGAYASVELWLAMYLALIVSAAACAAWLGHFLNRQMHGLGGDAYGAVVEASEAAMLVAAVAVV